MTAVVFPCLIATTTLSRKQSHVWTSALILKVKGVLLSESWVKGYWLFFWGRIRLAYKMSTIFLLYRGDFTLGTTWELCQVPFLHLRSGSSPLGCQCVGRMAKRVGATAVLSGINPGIAIYCMWISEKLLNLFVPWFFSPLNQHDFTVVPQ